MFKGFHINDNVFFSFRYSVVVFGGSNVFDQPRSVVINNEIFTTHQQIPSYFDSIPAGKIYSLEHCAHVNIYYLLLLLIVM